MIDDGTDLIFVAIGFALYLLFSFVVAHEATLSGRSRLAYLALSLLASPVLAGIVLGVQGPAPGSVKAKA